MEVALKFGVLVGDQVRIQIKKIKDLKNCLKGKKSAAPVTNEIPSDNDPRLKLARGQLPQGSRGKLSEKVKKDMPTESVKTSVVR